MSQPKIKVAKVKPYRRHEREWDIVQTRFKDSIWVDENDGYSGFRLSTCKPTDENKLQGNHRKNTLDRILKALKWILARHNQVLVVRFDFYSADSGISISDYLKPLSSKLKKLRFIDGEVKSTTSTKGEAIFKDLVYFWVKERGLSVYNQGVHYHCFIACRKLSTIQPSQIVKILENTTSELWRTKLENKLEKAEQEHTKVLLTNYLADLSKFKLNFESIKSEEREECSHPYLAICGYFWLEKNKLGVDKCKQQQEDMIQSIESNSGYKYLKISRIRNRKHHKNSPIGGVLDECIYALSYLSKVASKHGMFDDGERLFGISQL